MKQYDPRQVNVVWKGILLTGFADGSFVTVELNADAFTTTVGAYGDVVRTRSHNRTAKITIRLQAESPANDLLSIEAVDDMRGTGAPGPVMVSYTNGTTIASAPNAWVTKMPSLDFAAESGQREWVLECDTLDIFVGGTE